MSRVRTRRRSHAALRARRTLLVAAVALVAVACSSEKTIGPLTITPPEGWYVTDSETESIKITDGTIADELATKPGTATAVFDVYINSSQTVQEFERALRRENVKPKEERTRVGGYDAVIVSYGPSAFGPSTEVVFVPEWRVRVVYRAAFRDGESAFVENRPAFRTALRSIRFRGRPPARA
jgi:hypothetical protein